MRVLTVKVDEWHRHVRAKARIVINSLSSSHFALLVGKVSLASICVFFLTISLIAS
jgi:hypothetical protein